MSVRTLPVVVSCSCGCREQGRSRRLRFGQAGGVVGVKGPGALLPGNTPPQVGNKEGTEGSRKATSRVPYIRTHKETRVSPGSLCFAVLIPPPCLFPATRRLLLMLGPLPQRGRVYSRRRLVASSSCWGPCPRGRVYSRRRLVASSSCWGPWPCLFPATSRRLLLMLGPLPQRGRVYSRRRVDAWRRLVVSSASWGPCPTAAVLIRGTTCFMPGPFGAPPHAVGPAVTLSLGAWRPVDERGVEPG